MSPEISREAFRTVGEHPLSDFNLSRDAEPKLPKDPALESDAIYIRGIYSYKFSTDANP